MVKTMTQAQKERLYRKAYEKCSRQLFGEYRMVMDWQTLYVLSPSWYQTLKVLNNQLG
jgi:hypothetical protein